MCSRIRKCGGFVTWNSLGQANVNSRLAMTRSIGDFDLKQSGVIAEPETTCVTVSVALCFVLTKYKSVFQSAISMKTAVHIFQSFTDSLHVNVCIFNPTHKTPQKAKFTKNAD